MAQLLPNPFELLEQRLTSIEKMLVDIKNQNGDAISSQDPFEEIGGIQLAQQITGLAKPTIYALVSGKKIPYMKRGKRLYFSREELIAWIRSGRKEFVGEDCADALKLVLKHKKKSKV